MQKNDSKMPLFFPIFLGSLITKWPLLEGSDAAQNTLAFTSKLYNKDQKYYDFKVEVSVFCKLSLI